MFNKLFGIFFIFGLSIYATLDSMERNYKYEGVQLFSAQVPNQSGNRYEYATDEICKDCFFCAYGQFLPNITLEQFACIPDLPLKCAKKTCLACGKTPFYSGYIHFTYRGSYPFLIRQLLFMERYPHISCYWPEDSQEARNISDLAVILFSDLSENTPLDNFRFNSFRKKFVLTSPHLTKINKEMFIKSLVSSCFWFSDYYQVIEDLRIFSRKNLFASSQVLVEDKLESIQEQLEKRFTEWYSWQQSVCYTPEIAQELKFIRYLTGRWNLEEINDENWEPEEVIAEQPRWFLAQYHLVKGQEYNQAMMYEEAIEQLNQSIEYNSGNLDAYIERAFAYFELQQFDLAIEDYKNAKRNRFHTEFFYKEMGLFSDGTQFAWSDQGGYVVISYGILAKEFCAGTIEGAHISATEFVPNTLGTLSGIGQGLWAFVSSPNEVSQKFLDGMYNSVKYIKDHSTQEMLEQMIPELRVLVQDWDYLSNSERSNKMGFIVGKYGFDIFAPCAVLKGIKRFQELKRANTMLTLESCLTKKKRIKILEEVVKRDAWRQRLLKDGKIGIHWGRQNKHIPGAHNFDPKRGELLVTKQRLKNLLNDKMGCGQKIRGDISCSPGYKERIEFGEIIGKYAYKKGEDVVKIPTTRGVAHYSKDGVHVVPSAPWGKL